MSNVAETKLDQEAQFIDWLLAHGKCPVAGSGHRCKGPREALRGAAGGHVLLCGRAADELHERTGWAHESWDDQQLRELVDIWIATELARWEAAKLTAQLEGMDELAARRASRVQPSQADCARRAA